MKVEPKVDPKQPSAMGEFRLIERFFKNRAAAERDAGVILGIGDDAAVLRLPAGEDLVAAVDTIVAGTHFPLHTAARSIGHRALAVNLSDLAAMGASPAWATLALTIPAAQPQWLEEFRTGLFDLAAEHKVALVGGDTTRGPLTVSVQLLGTVPAGASLRRAGAAAGDLLTVSGTLGDGGAGLALSLREREDATAAAEMGTLKTLRSRFDYPTPRVQLGLAARGLASAAMDLSDGLVGDLPKLAAASGLGALVALERLPLSDALLAYAGLTQARDWALSAGDDYELLLAVPPGRYAQLELAAKALNLTLTVIGELQPGAGVAWTLNGASFEPAGSGYDHFAQASM